MSDLEERSQAVVDYVADLDAKRIDALLAEPFAAKMHEPFPLEVSPGNVVMMVITEIHTEAGRSLRITAQLQDVHSFTDEHTLPF